MKKTLNGYFFEVKIDGNENIGLYNTFKTEKCGDVQIAEFTTSVAYNGDLFHLQRLSSNFLTYLDCKTEEELATFLKSNKALYTNLGGIVAVGKVYSQDGVKDLESSIVEFFTPCGVLHEYDESTKSFIPVNDVKGTSRKKYILCEKLSALNGNSCRLTPERLLNAYKKKFWEGVKDLDLTSRYSFIKTRLDLK